MNTAVKPFVCLRAMEPEDLDMLYGIENDFNLWAVGNTNVPYSRYALHEYMASATGDIYTDKQVRLIVMDATRHPIGMLDLVNFVPQHNRAEVGIVIQKPYRNQGYGEAAMGELLEYARRVLHLHQLYAIVGSDNAFCQQLFERVGFQCSARLTEWLYDGAQYQDAVVMQYFLKKK